MGLILLVDTNFYPELVSSNISTRLESLVILAIIFGALGTLLGKTWAKSFWALVLAYFKGLFLQKKNFKFVFFYFFAQSCTVFSTNSFFQSPFPFLAQIWYYIHRISY